MRLTFAELVEPERLTGSGKWAVNAPHANLTVMRPLITRAPTYGGLISRAKQADAWGRSSGTQEYAQKESVSKAAFLRFFIRSRKRKDKEKDMRFPEFQQFIQLNFYGKYVIGFENLLDSQTS